MLNFACGMLMSVACVAGAAQPAGTPGTTRAAAAAAIAPAAPAGAPAVFLVMSDGLRWQEVFAGADERLISSDQGVTEGEALTLRQEFWRDTPEARREALMPFFWGTIAKQGVVFGNRSTGSISRIENMQRVSYPGYSEIFCGFVNDKIDSNKKVPNPYATVFEWLHTKEAFKGRVAAFGGWDVFPFIFNAERCGFPVDGGHGPIDLPVKSERLATLSRLRQETPYRWAAAPFDSFVFLGAMEYIRLAKPRAMFLGLGETDEWGHEGQYDQYLIAARRFDTYLRELWETLQAMPEYAGRTTLIITCDHGRGGDVGPAHPGAELKQWRDHNAKVVGAEETWIAVIGPTTEARGVLGEKQHTSEPTGSGKEPAATPTAPATPIPVVTHTQIAATIALVIGEDYREAQPRAGAPLPHVSKWTKE